MAITDKVLFFGDLVTDTGSSRLYPLGTKREQDGQVYRYVKRNDATVAFAANDLVYRAGGTTEGAYWEVLGDVSDVDAAFVVGVAMSAIANGEYGWIKTKGQVTALKKKPGTAAYSLVKGDLLIAAAAATDDGRASRYIGVTGASVAGINAGLRAIGERIVGWAVAAATKSSATCNAYIDLE